MTSSGTNQGLQRRADAESASSARQPYPTRDETAAQFAAHVNRGRARVLTEMGIDIVIGEREGGRFRDAYSGRWYWNCHCNGGVFNFGHRHPALVEALRSALDHLDVGNHHLISGWRARLAAQLAESTAGALPYAVFTPSGTEAVDLAIWLARSSSGRQKVISAGGAFHGLAGLARAAGDERWQRAQDSALPGFERVPFNDGPALEQALDAQTAAVILESIPATLGFPMPEPGYLRRAGDLARANGALLILDEVQTGLGRTGSNWLYQQEDAEPDIVITGKGLGGGLYPVSAALISDRLEEFFDADPFAYISSFGGAELGCAVAGALMDQVLQPGFTSRVRELGERFERGFDGLPFELRRRGLTMGLRFDAEQGGVTAAKALIDSGVFAVYAEHDHSVTQLKPPLILRDDEADEIIEAVRGALG